MLKKIASLAAMLSAAMTVSACQTAAYKPIICEPGTALKGGRCQKVPQSVKDERRALEAARAKPKAKSTLKAKPASAGQSIDTPIWAQPSLSQPTKPRPSARQSEYGTTF